MKNEALELVNEALEEARKTILGLQRDINHRTNYKGPVCTAGGYWRDRALGLEPKDLDIMIRAGTGSIMIYDLRAIVATIAEYFEGTAIKQRMIPCYGDWADDLHCLFKFDVIANDGSLIREVDLIVLMGSIYPVENFLGHCLNRVDIRLNSIGAGPEGWSINANWLDDVINQRLVIHNERLPINERLKDRLEYLSGPTKFPGWKAYYELTDDVFGPIVEIKEPFGEFCFD